jgi:hypothetical protein|tara:strand:- start:242 stop:484 length:243 start_codon:yes stop_codon:yes gene_type:complete
MVIFISVEVQPPELLAQIVYVTDVVCRIEGVPLMAPVDELNVSPLGIDGLISHVVALPPLIAGVVVVIDVPFSSTKSCEE